VKNLIFYHVQTHIITAHYFLCGRKKVWFVITLRTPQVFIEWSRTTDMGLFTIPGMWKVASSGNTNFFFISSYTPTSNRVYLPATICSKVLHHVKFQHTLQHLNNVVRYTELQYQKNSPKIKKLHCYLQDTIFVYLNAINRYLNWNTDILYYIILYYENCISRGEFDFGLSQSITTYTSYKDLKVCLFVSLFYWRYIKTGNCLENILLLEHSHKILLGWPNQGRW